MADNDQNSSGAQGSDEAPKDERDYVLSGEEDESEKASPAEEAEKAKKAQKSDNEADDDDDDDADDDDDGDQSDDENSGKARKRKRGGFQKKISRLEAENAELAKRLANIEQSGQKKDDTASQKKSEDAPPERPDPKDFKDYEAYSEALTDWKVDQRLRQEEEKRQTEAKKSEFKKQQETKVERYEEGIEAARELHDDFDDVIEEYDGPLTIGMQQALLDSDMGPQVAYYIAQNPKVGEKMASMTIIQLNKEVARIEARLEAKSSKGSEDEDAAASRKTSKAPPPIDPAKGSSKSKKSSDDQSYEEYLKERQKRRGS